MTLQPATVKIDADAIRAEAKDLLTLKTKITHDLVLREILDSFKQPIDFRAEADIDAGEKISQKIQIVVTIRKVLEIANDLKCGLCRQLDFIY